MEKIVAVVCAPCAGIKHVYSMNVRIIPEVKNL